MKKIQLLATLLASVFGAQAAFYWNGSNWDHGSVVPDNNYSGWTDSLTVSGSGGSIAEDSLQVNLTLSGGWNGDLYAYLVHEGGFAVLLDRVGTTGSGYGYGTSGMNVWLTDSGSYPSIETTELPTSGETYLRAGYAGSLASFNGLAADGTWTLFIADLSGGGVTTVSDWGLQMDIVAVPEVEVWVAAALAGAFGAFWLNRQIFGPKKA
jgi:hypothetical protein